MICNIKRTLLLSHIFIIGLFSFQTTSDAKENSQNLKDIQTLEQTLFESDISIEQINQLLKELTDSKKRSAAKAKLSQNCHQHIQRMIDFALVCDDLEARQACADIVEALDASYKTTANGKALQKLYRDKATQRLPEYWRRFQKNSNDHRAVAFLMAVDAKKTYAWLKTYKGHDRHDQIRYLLLRIRELEKDQFVLDHLFEHSANAVRRAARDVFPHVIHRTGLGGFYSGDSIRFLTAHRFVGHVIIKPLALRGSIIAGFSLHNKGYFKLKDWRSDQPFISGVTRYSKWIAVCRYQSAFKNGKTDACLLQLKPFTYAANKGYLNRVNGKRVPRPPSVSYGIGRRFQIFRRELDYLPRGLYPVPRVQLKKQQQILINQGKTSGWAKVFLAKQFHRYLYPTPSQSQNSKPETIQAVDALKRQAEFDRSQIPSVIANNKKQLPKDALSVVILPPHLQPDATTQEKNYAEAIADYLATSLDNSHIARVVNRQHMQQILNERAIAKGANHPLLSYDMIVRFDMRNKQKQSQATISVLDLSTGNPLATADISFPLLKKDFVTIVKVCQQAIQKFKRPEKKRLKVRFLGGENVDRNTRMNSLAHRLQSVMQESLRQSQQVIVVEHLEAMTSQEESLLLYSGLSRLAGGRLFAPQADATLALRIQGKDVLDKDFKKTPVEVSVQFLRKTQKEAQWKSFQGTVETFDKSITQSWESIAKEIKGVPPLVVKDVLSSLATRHRQAEKELDAVEMLIKSSAPIEKIIQRALTAIKLNPTSERARYTYLNVRRSEIFNLLSTCPITTS